MTIPFALPFARRRLVFSFELKLVPPAVRVLPRRATELPAAIDSSDAALARLNRRPDPVDQRIHWETEAAFLGWRRH